MVVALLIALGRARSSVHSARAALDTAVAVVLPAVVFVGPAGVAYARAVGAAPVADERVAVQRPALFVAVVVAALESTVADLGGHEPRRRFQRAVVV